MRSIWRACEGSRFAIRPAILRWLAPRWKHRADSFLNPNNSQYIEHIYELWLKDSKSVDPSWDAYFKLIASNSSVRSHETLKKKLSETKSSGSWMEETSQARSLVVSRGGDETLASANSNEGSILDIDATIRAYQARGHLIADVDPLGIQNPESSKLQGTPNLPPAVVVREHLSGMTESDMNREFSLGSLTMIGGDKKKLPLREILIRLNQVYCGHLGLEYTYIHDMQVLDWLRQKFEIPGAWQLSPDHRKWIWMNIMKAVTFEGFLAKKFGTEKRFGLEGCESFVPAVTQCFETSAEHGVETIAIGMAHRGRLNTLVNICEKPMNQLFTQFNPLDLEGVGSGDVKYHLGTHSERLLERCGKTIRVAMMANPSHLEAVSPLIVGRVRAEQVAKGDVESEKSMAILVHGDAAFAGQGICYETMHLTSLPEYTTGGVVHAVINNQIGFTTDPRYSRSSAHCTDCARVVNAPIFHVHADDPDLVAYCSKVASEYRAVYHNDVVLDIVGYRRNGHNEMDEPMLTQPLMYKRIKEHPNVLTVYTEKLVKEGIIDEAFTKEEVQKYLDHCESEFKKAQSTSTMQMKDWHDVPWTDFFANQSPDKKIPSTGIDMDTIVTIFTAVSTVPAGIEAHSQRFPLVHQVLTDSSFSDKSKLDTDALRVYRCLTNSCVKICTPVSQWKTLVLDKRKKLMKARQIDWAMGENLAILSLLKEGHHVRLSGQDVERGTFSHRIHIIHDQMRDKTWKNILHDVFPNQALYTATNSSLSEYGVLGFELGYSAYDHNTLTIWEAQFGDFANSCQVIIDSLLCSAQSKWGKQMGLVVLLPHGMEGQGPEHSSARLERFLQLADEDCTHMPEATKSTDSSVKDTAEEIMTRQIFETNWIVCNLTTPGNIFHALRRQILMPFRKPLIVMTPKSLLRHPMAISPLEEVESGTSFKPIYPEAMVKNDSAIEKVLICSGKVYYDLVTERQGRNLDDRIAIVRVEQLCPFPFNLIAKEVSRFSKAKIMWLQEEHKNQGAYYYVRDRLALALGVPLEDIEYGGRPISSSPATGSKIIYKQEYENMISSAMSLD